MCLATRGSHIVSSSGSWLKAKRVSWHTFGEIKVILYKVDVACEGQGHAGSTPATSTMLFNDLQKSKVIPARFLPKRVPFYAISCLPVQHDEMCYFRSVM